MASFHELTGVLFKKAEALMLTRGPSSDYMASAVHGDGEHWYAAYAAPGWLPQFVYDEFGHPYVFNDIKSAESKASVMLIASLNANLDEGWIDGLREPPQSN